MATARAFAAGGARVAMNDLGGPALDEAVHRLRSEGLHVSAHAADVSDESEVVNMMSSAASSLGGIDVAINNAGLYPSCMVVDMTATEWDRVMNTNARGTFLVAREAARHMVRGSTGGHIISIGSGSWAIGRVGSAHYCASKAAVVMLTRVLAMELAPHRIQVNVISPGLIETDRLDAGYKAAFVNQVPWGRAGRPEEVAAACLMLVAAGCEFLTGQVIGVDGGASAGRYGLPVAGPPGGCSGEVRSE